MAPTSETLVMSTHAKPASFAHAQLTELVSCMQEIQELKRQLDMVRQQNVSAGQQAEVHLPSKKAQAAVSAALQVPPLLQCMACYV